MAFCLRYGQDCFWIPIYCQRGECKLVGRISRKPKEGPGGKPGAQKRGKGFRGPQAPLPLFSGHLAFPLAFPGLPGSPSHCLMEVCCKGISAREGQPGKPRNVQEGPGRPGEAQGGPGRRREAQGGLGRPRKAQGSPGRPREGLESPGRPWKAQGVRGTPREPQGVAKSPWESLGLPGTPWDFLRFPGTPFPGPREAQEGAGKPWKRPRKASEAGGYSWKLRSL